MNHKTRWLTFAVAALVLLPTIAGAQGMTGTLIATVKDAQGGVLPRAIVRLTSPALIGGPVTLVTNEKGPLRFSALPPGLYALDVEYPAFAPYHEDAIRIGAGATIERTTVLKVAGVAESLVVEGAGSRIEARDPGFGTRFGSDDLRTIPTRRSSMFDLIRAAPGISPTSPGSGTVTTLSAFGSGTNENQFLIDGTNFTCPCNGVARAEPGVDFIQEIQVQSVGASVEFGNVQGAVINVITRQGGERWLPEASYYGQTAGLTSHPVHLAMAAPATGQSGYERARYRDLTLNLGGPALRDRLWVFAGAQYLRDYDSQPGTDPRTPRAYDQNKIFAKLTWKLSHGLQLLQSFHDEFWVNPEQPTLGKPFATTLRQHASVPAITFGDLTHTSAGYTVWDVRAGRFVYARRDDPSTGDRNVVSRLDRSAGVTSGGPPQIGSLTLIRTTAKATLSHYRPGLLGADHEWKVGAQLEKGEGHGTGVIPTGVRYEDRNGAPSQMISAAPSITGGMFVTGAVFASDGVTMGGRLTINAGIRFDHSRAISEDLRAIDAEGHETREIVRGLGTLYTWNLLSPRLGVTAKITGDARTMLRGSYGRFNQGVLTGEFSGFHPGVTPVTTAVFEAATGGYTRVVKVVDAGNLQLDRNLRAPHTDEYSIGLDREVGRRLAVAIAYVRKDGANFIGWTDIGGQYRQEQRPLPDGRSLPVFALVNTTADQKFLLTNPRGYSLTYNGLVTALETRRTRHWRAFASYTFSRSSGLQASNGTTAAGAQSSSVALPTVPIGRDPNELTNARGRLPNDRPHMIRLMGTIDVPRTGFVIAANFQCFSGKPWAATTQVDLPQGEQRVMLEPRGSRRLPAQTLLDIRMSRTISRGGMGRADLFVDVLNALNDAAAEGLQTDSYFNANFGRPTVFMDPRRAMVGVRLSLGR